MNEIKKAIETLRKWSVKNAIIPDEDFPSFEMAISALEKQIPIKGIPYDNYKNHIFVECGACHKNMDMYYDYCPKCGQRIDWSVE